MVNFMWNRIGSESSLFQLGDFGVTISFAFPWSCFYRTPIPASPFALTVHLEALSRRSYPKGVTECCAETTLYRGKSGRKETGYSFPIRFKKRDFGLETWSHLCKFREKKLEFEPKTQSHIHPSDNIGCSVLLSRSFLVDWCLTWKKMSNF